MPELTVKVPATKVREYKVEIGTDYLIPYMITGMLNEHPRAGIAMRKTPDKNMYAKFYEEIRDVTG